MALSDPGLPPSDVEGERIRDDVADELHRLYPELRVTRTEYRESFASVHGYLLPDWLAVLFGAGFFTTLLLVTAGPQPWRATRWAWFWLLTVPFGALAFAVFSGPTPGVRPPREGIRRLTGGWAFLLSGLLTALFPEGPAA